MGLKTSNESLYHELASHGYVVCSIDHTYQCLFTTNARGNRIWIDTGYAKELITENAREDKQQSYEYYKKWMDIRTGDLDFLIDYVLGQAESNSTSEASMLIDTEKIGVMGHSLGGSAALGIGRSRDDVSAVIALESPFMGNVRHVEDNKFIWNEEKYPVPLLHVYSDSAWEHLSEWPQYEKNYKLLSGTEENNFLSI